jgi:hypothetical protein
MRGELTALSHDIKNSDMQWSHSQTRSQLPNAHKKRVIWDVLSACLIVDRTSKDEILEASECSSICVRKLNKQLNLILLIGPRELVPVVRRLGTKEILLNTKGNLFGSYKDDDEDRMRLTVDKLMMDEPSAIVDVLPRYSSRSLACLNSEINALISHGPAL